MSTKRAQKQSTTHLTNHEIIVLAVYLVGGRFRHVDLEDVAVKANEIAPGRFVWRKYKDQINIDIVNKRLWDAIKPEKGGYLVGSQRNGWLLTESGVKFTERHMSFLDNVDLSRARVDPKEKAWETRERQRMLVDEAYRKYTAGQLDEVTSQEAERFFRVDDYVVGTARQARLHRVINFFGDDPQLGAAAKELIKKVREG